VTLVGYTNAGKSSLLNRLTNADVPAEDRLFVTLDPRTRQYALPGGETVLFTDTVGFIRNLPTHLVAAFQSTLEEVTYSDFVLHVVDLANPAWEVQRDAVLATLETLGAQDKPMLTVFNKIDIFPNQTELRQIVADWPNSVAISSLTGEGMPDLQAAIKKMVQELLGAVKVLIPYAHQYLLQECYDYGRVLKEEYGEQGIYVEAELVDEMRNKLAQFAVE
jgi:GTP-binding protein HflX